MYRGGLDDASTGPFISHLAIAADQLAICDGVPAWLASLRPAGSRSSASSWVLAHRFM